MHVHAQEGIFLLNPRKGHFISVFFILYVQDLTLNGQDNFLLMFFHPER